RYTHQNPENVPDETAGRKGKAVTDIYTKTEGETDGPPEVVVFVAINNRGHSWSEIPQILQSLKYLKENEGIDRKLIVVKDPVDDDQYRKHMKPGQRNKQQYDATAEMTSLGAVNAARTSTWYDSRAKSDVGKVSVDGQHYQLGGYQPGNKGVDNSSVWESALIALGLDSKKAEDVGKMLFYHHYDQPEEPVAGDIDMKKEYWNSTAYNEGALELLHLVSVLNRAEEGEFVIKNLIVSGHHYGGDRVIFGAHDSENSDSSDYFDLNILYSLSRVFPKAFADIESLNLAACGTDFIGEPYEDSGMDISELSTLQMSGYNSTTSTFDYQNPNLVFPGLNVYSNWEGICPASTNYYGHRGLAKAFTMGNVYNASLTEAETKVLNTQSEEIAKNYEYQQDLDGDGTIRVEKGQGYLSTTQGNRAVSSLFPGDFSYMSIDRDTKQHYYQNADFDEYIYKSAGPVHQLATEDLQSYLSTLPVAENRSSDQQLYAEQVTAEMQWRTCVTETMLLQMMIYNVKNGGSSA
ncbi:MAG: hypothetical protein AAFO69_20095, partial [Bacteroidota bacterium]